MTIAPRQITAEYRKELKSFLHGGLFSLLGIKVINVVWCPESCKPVSLEEAYNLSQSKQYTQPLSQIAISIRECSNRHWPRPVVWVFPEAQALTCKV